MQKANERKTAEDAGFSNYLKLIDALFCEPNPTPVKWALQQMGIIKSAECRLPLLELSEKGQKT
ncbi:MAG: dihydrodipicolinate synthase family protein [Bdellovibrionales bacterium]